MSNFDIAKYNMIEQQIRPVEVMDTSILEALNTLNRHEFVPAMYQHIAYADCQIPFSDAQTMMKPIIEAKMLQALHIKETDNCLDVGTGTGYFTACLSSLSRTVHSIDIDEGIQKQAEKNLSEGFSNVSFEHANALKTVGASKMYDVIAVTSSVNEVPENFKQAMNIGGRLFIIVGQTPVMQAMLITRDDVDTWTSSILFETEINPLIN